ncbi:hypothetical protein SASPL_129314 [Salvia splendens]|uniref:Uncharacterized protein n=1 Tax=Salvia splendens TaxID=180675 RepID=A0A8X8ZNM7_SALSN|nr:hypothetical protein SASPL_129314 [Salvia splendens]
MQDAPQATGQLQLKISNRYSSQSLELRDSIYFQSQFSVDRMKSIDKLVLNNMQQPSCMQAEECHISFITSRNVAMITDIHALLLMVAILSSSTCCSGKENGVRRAEIAKQLNVPEHKIM